MALIYILNDIYPDSKVAFAYRYVELYSRSSTYAFIVCSIGAETCHCREISCLLWSTNCCRFLALRAVLEFVLPVHCKNGSIKIVLYLV